jgi:hypothetical protein
VTAGNGASVALGRRFQPAASHDQAFLAIEPIHALVIDAEAFPP